MAKAVTVTGAGGANIAALDAIRRAKELYAPGGAFGTGVEAAISRGRTKAVSVGAQELVGTGLAGTTMMGGLGKRYEEEVGMPARMGIEEERMRAMAGLEMQMAGMIEQAGQARTQREFEAVQASAQRSLQKYIADMQAGLQREQTALQRSTTAPTGGYAKQFPSIYGQTGRAIPSLSVGDFGFDDVTPWTPAAPREEPTPTFTTQPPGVGPLREKTYTPQTYLEEFAPVPTSWTPGPTGLSPAASYYAGVPQQIGDIKLW